MGSNELLVDELLRNLGFGIAPFFTHHHLQVQVAPHWFSREFYAGEVAQTIPDVNGVFHISGGVLLERPRKSPR